MDATPDEIPGYFKEYGWGFERHSDGLFRTAFSGDHGRFDIWLSVGEAWISFVITPFIEKRGDTAHPLAVKRLILHANDRIHMAKFGLTDDGDVSLSVELPTEGFRYSHFSDAMTAISHYADEYREAFLEARDEADGEVV